MGIYTGCSEDSPVMMSKGVLTVDAPVEKVTKLLNSGETTELWVGRMQHTDPMFIDGKIIEKKAGSKRVLYGQWKLPWPCWGRDFVWFNYAPEVADEHGFVYNLADSPGSGETYEPLNKKF